MTVRESTTPAGRHVFEIEDASGHENRQKLLLTEDEARDLHLKLRDLFHESEAR